MSAGRFAGKVALVTGAGSGIGQASALRLAAEGADIICFDLNGAASADTAERASASGVRSTSLAVDVADDAQVAKAIAEVVEKHGRIDTLIHCAGVAGPLGGPTDIDIADFEQTMKINVSGSFLVCKYALPHIIAQRGSVVLIASVAALSGAAPPTVGPLVAYTTSKHAVIGLVRSIAYQYGADGVRANAICPGSIDTSMTQRVAEVSSTYARLVEEGTPLKRWGQASEIAAAAAFLASEDAAFISGDALVVDGGYMTAHGKVYPRFEPN